MCIPSQNIDIFTSNAPSGRLYASQPPACLYKPCAVGTTETLSLTRPPQVCKRERPTTSHPDWLRGCGSHLTTSDASASQSAYTRQPVAAGQPAVQPTCKPTDLSDLRAAGANLLSHHRQGGKEVSKSISSLSSCGNGLLFSQVKETSPVP